MTNVLFIMADELSTFGLGRYGGLALTPHLDALAQRGTQFDTAYTPSPICVPTRAAIATGQYLNRIGHWSSAEAYDGQIPGWGHALQTAGLPVTSIGKLHYRRTRDLTGFDRQIEPIHIPDGIGWVLGLLRDPLPDYTATEAMALDIGSGETDYTRFDRRVTAEACRWLMNAPDRPWCTFVSYLSPHYPLIAPPTFYNLYDPAAFEGPSSPLPDHPILREIGTFFDHDRFFDPKTRGIARAAYYGLCSFLDAQIGQVLSALAASGQADDTVIIFTSDHGEMLGEKGFWGKSTMYDSAARVPLIVAGPGIGVDDLRDDPVSLIDIAPTICAAMEVEPPADMQGRSLLDGAQPDRTVISEYHDGGASVGITMVRWHEWKYVHYAQGHPPQLFDLSKDPDETDDLSDTRPDMLAEGRRRMATLLDAEATDARAHADQVARVAALGGREKLLAMEQWNYTPADSR